jgi:hypothetical protein
VTSEAVEASVARAQCSCSGVIDGSVEVSWSVAVDASCCDVWAIRLAVARGIRLFLIFFLVEGQEVSNRSSVASKCQGLRLD